METIQYSPLNDLHKNQAPDQAKINVANETLIIHPNSVIVRSPSGSIISLYKDMVWDIRHYGSLSPIYFNNFGLKNVYIVKKILYGLLIFGNKSGNIAASSLYEAKTVLVHIERYIKTIDSNFLTFLQDKNILFEYSKILALPSQAANFKQLILNLQEYDSYIDIKVPVDKDRDLLLAQKAAEGSKNRKQTPIIPPEIFNKSYFSRWKNFEIIEKNIELIIGFIVEYANSWYFARDGLESRSFRSKPSKMVTFSDAVTKYKLDHIFKTYGVTCSSGISDFYSHLSKTCAHLISATTGMRKNELLKLTHGCFHSPTLNRPAIIKGIETKSNKGPRDQEWVTSIDTGRVIVLLEKIGKVLCNNINLEDKEKIPLFLKKNTYFPTIRKESIVHNRDIMGTLHGKELNINEHDLILTQKMMDNFLKKTHSYGRWDEEDRMLKVGKPWVFSWHQYRRTFAFLSVNSGLVTLPSLQRQLAHNFISIAAYYANGAINIGPIIKEKDPMLEEVNEMRNEQAAIAMSLNIRNNVQNLKSEMLEWAKKINDGDMEIEDHVILHKYLLKETRKGNIVMKPTSIGFCTKNGPCNSHLTFQFTDCGNCDDALPNYDHIIDSLSKTKASIEFLINQGYAQDSLEMRTQLLEKEYFKEQLNKIGVKK